MSLPEEQSAAGRPVARPLTASTAGEWHRLHPLSPVVSAGPRFAAILVVLLLIAVAGQRHDGGDLVGDVIVVAVVLVGGFIRWLVTRWQVAEGVLRVDTGLLRRDSRRFPLSQVQAIDVVQTGIARVLGLAELRLRVAGGDAARRGQLAWLRRADAERLREELLALAATAARTLPARGPAPPEPAAAPDPTGAAQGRLLFRVNSGRLAGAVLLSRTGAVALVAIAVLIGIGEWTGQPGVVFSFLPVCLGAALGTWRQFNAEFATTVSAAPDGLRLRSGLIQTAAETIRPGRVQAVRLVEPMIWRAFGWCRVEVDVAGPRERRQASPEGKRLRALIPVGSRTEAEQLMRELTPARPAPTRRPPRAARWKAPLMYHFLAYGSDERYVVAAHGRVCRKTTWVPLEKVQSVRWTQGPVQRRLGLASVWLDVAGRRMSACIRERAAAEADDLLDRMPDLARAARARRA